MSSLNYFLINLGIVNSYVFMNGGIDYVYSEHFGPQIQEDLQAKIADEYYGELPVGQATIVPLDDPDYKWLISAPTMRVPMDVSDTVNAYWAFRAALIEVINHNKTNDNKIESILCPGLGTMVGKMHPKICAMQMYLAYRLVIKKDSFQFSDLGSAYIMDQTLRGK
jgi:O-acetyl-ADP-ribose deacetylase (regulator of RNase III)